MLWGRLGRILADEFVVEARRVRSLGLPRHMVEQGRGHQQRDRSERHRQDAAEELQVHREGEDEDREGGDKPEEDDLARPERHMGHVRLLLLRLDQLHRSEEHTSELQSLMRISYAVFCLKKKKLIKNI